jgi:K+-transporting ATPase KdpF subunit
MALEFIIGLTLSVLLLGYLLYAMLYPEKL